MPPLVTSPRPRLSGSYFGILLYVSDKAFRGGKVNHCNRDLAWWLAYHALLNDQCIMMEWKQFQFTWMPAQLQVGRGTIQHGELIGQQLIQCI